MSGFTGGGAAETVGTWVAALITLAVWAYLFGERRVFRYAQHLLAGLLTGFVVVISVREVLIPDLVQPLAADPAGTVTLWPAAVLAGILVGSRYLPRRVVAVPVSVIIGGTAAFALAGAVAGTLMPQLAASIAPRGADGVAIAESALAVVIVAAVLLAFRHDAGWERRRFGLAQIGRWILLTGLGGWFGFILLSRLVLLVERVGFLLVDWLGISR